MDGDDDIDFFFYDEDGTLARDDLEEEFLECFLLPAHTPQRVRFLGSTILTTIHLGLSSLPTTGRARLLDKVRQIFTTLNNFQAIPGVGGAVFGPRAPPLYPWSHYVRLFSKGPAFPGCVQNTWAEIMLSYHLFDRLEVLTRALVVTFDLALSSSAFNLECSRSFATLFLPQFTTAIAILERVISPPSPFLLTGVPFGPLTVADHKATMPRTPPSSTTALPPHPSLPLPPPQRALTSCRCAGGARRRLARRLAAPSPSPRPRGASTFFCRGTRVRFDLSPPPFHESSQDVLSFAAAFAAEPKEPP